MKTLLAAAALFATLAPLVAGGPPITIRQALDIADKSLRDRNLQGKIYIEAASLERSSLVGGHQFWFVKWSESLPASNPRNREVGVKVYMDGKASRLVKE